MRFSLGRGLRRGLRFLSTAPAVDTDVVVIGAGVVGLAVARALSLKGREVMVLDAGPAIGTETSSRNSEVIHAGLYYEPESVKQRTCVQGHDMLVAFCEEYSIPYHILGKILVATMEAQKPGLDSIRQLAWAAGRELTPLSQAELREMEPDLSGVAGLFSPLTGIIDSHSFMTELVRQIEEKGGMVVLNSRVLCGNVVSNEKSLVVEDVGSGESATLCCRAVVNATGLWAQDLSKMLAGIDPTSIPPRYFAKGSYFALSGVRAPFQHLIYPLPEKGGLGVHLTLDLTGAARFGPDTEWMVPGTDPGDLDYAVDPLRRPAFEKAVRSYWPGLPEGDHLVPAYSGIRPKLVPQGHPAADFLIQGPVHTGCSQVAALYGIESPGLTASLALAEIVSKELS